MDVQTLTNLCFIVFCLTNVVHQFLVQEEHDFLDMIQLINLSATTYSEYLPWLEPERRQNIENQVTDLELLISLITTVKKGRRPRAFWSIRKSTGSYGFWEKQVLDDWQQLHRSGQDLNDYIRTRFKEAVRMEPDVFMSLVAICEPLISKQCTILRDSISTEKRLAIFLDWLGHGSTLSSLARTYDVGKLTVHSIVHECTEVLFEHLVHKEIRFPEGAELTPTMRQFHKLCFLPGCVGALDGTFIKMEKPTSWGDRYFCYKNYCAIILLACVDADGLFTYIHAGTPGCCGDAHVWNKCSLHDDLSQILVVPAGHENSWKLSGTNHIMQPYIVADSAFSLSNHVMKCYETDHPTKDQFNFNYAVIRTRRVVECAFGRLKGRFAILKNTRLRDPEFVSKLTSVCCAIHNMIERTTSACTEPAPAAPVEAFDPSHVIGIYGRPTGDTLNNPAFAEGGQKRDTLATHVRRVLNIQPVLQEKSQNERQRHMSRVLNGPVGFAHPAAGHEADLFNN